MSDYIRVGAVTDFADGEIETFEIEGEEVAVVSWMGTFYAFGNVCTHRQVPLSAGFLTDDNEVVCALHGAVYDLATGECLRGPTQGESVPSYKVRVEGGEVLVGERSHAGGGQADGEEPRLGRWWLKE